MKKKKIAEVTNPKKPILEKSLAFVNPEIAAEWDYRANYPLTPIDVSYGTTFAVYFICPKEKHSYKMRINNRTSSNKSDCPFCAKYGEGVYEKNCLGTLNLELSKEWHLTKNKKITPWDVRANSIKNVWWKCKKCNQEWMASIEQRHLGHQSCPRCNTLAYLYPELIKEWHLTKNHKFTPYNISYGSGKKIWWKCKKCNQEWKASVDHRTSSGTGCPFCSSIILRDGIVCASLIEAYYYLKYKKEHKKFKHNKKYDNKFGRYRYDFYFFDTNTYVEVTSYGSGSFGWDKYFKKIQLKKRYVENNLNANFEFIQKKLTPKQTWYVRRNIKQ